MRLQGKVAVVTGAGSGIGRAIATLFATEGAGVVIVDVQEASARETSAAIREQGSTAALVVGDVTREETAQAVVRTANREFSRFDILANVAGTASSGAITELTEEEFYRVVDVNLKAVMLMCKHAIPAMQASGGGSIINIGSAAALRARPLMPLYVATKGAVVALTRALAIDCAPANIRANCICPSATETPMLAAHYARMADGEDAYRRNIAMIPMQRLATPADMAYAALYLASDESGYVTGQVLAVDGGSSAGTAAK